jgi:hypothetical protein
VLKENQPKERGRVAVVTMGDLPELPSVCTCVLGFFITWSAGLGGNRKNQLKDEDHLQVI